MNLKEVETILEELDIKAHKKNGNTVIIWFEDFKKEMTFDYKVLKNVLVFLNKNRLGTFDIIAPSAKNPYKLILLNDKNCYVGIERSINYFAHTTPDNVKHIRKIYDVVKLKDIKNAIDNNYYYNHKILSIKFIILLIDYFNDRKNKIKNLLIENKKP